jgi:DNA-binding beta-propeller fold protein YncE
VTPDGRRVVAVAGDTGTIYVIDVATRSVVAAHRFDGPVEGIAIGLDGRAFTIDRATGRLLSVPID